MSTKRSLSAISMVLQNTQIYLESEKSKSQLLNQSEFHVDLAISREDRAKAYALGYKTYLEKGYIDANERGMLINSTDAYRDTTVFNVWSKSGKLAGTATLIFDTNEQILPCEKLFTDEVNASKVMKGRSCEVSRLCIADDFKNSKEVLALLINYMMIYATYVKNCQDTFIQVNPRHVSFYSKLLEFKKISDEKLNNSVKGAPAILLHLNTFVFEERVAYYETIDISNCHDRSLYMHFLPSELENLAANYLLNQFQIMSEEDKIWFELDEIEIDLAF